MGFLVVGLFFKEMVLEKEPILEEEEEEEEDNNLGLTHVLEDVPAGDEAMVVYFGIVEMVLGMVYD